MTEEQLQARLAQMQAQQQQMQALAQQYGLAPQQASQIAQAYNQVAGDGRYSGTMADYFAARAQGQVPTATNQFPPAIVRNSSPEVTYTPGGDGRQPPPPRGDGTGRQPPPPRGDGSDRTPRPDYSAPPLRDPIGRDLGALGPITRGPRVQGPRIDPTQGGGGVGGEPVIGGGGPSGPTSAGLLGAFGYMQGPNGEILPQMIRGGWSPYQNQGPAGLLQGYAPSGAQGLTLPQLGYDPTIAGFAYQPVGGVTGEPVGGGQTTPPPITDPTGGNTGPGNTGPGNTGTGPGNNGRYDSHGRVPRGESVRSGYVGGPLFGLPVIDAPGLLGALPGQSMPKALAGLLGR